MHRVDRQRDAVSVPLGSSQPGRPPDVLHGPDAQLQLGDRARPGFFAGKPQAAKGPAPSPLVPSSSPAGDLDPETLPALRHGRPAEGAAPKARLHHGRLCAGAMAVFAPQRQGAPSTQWASAQPGPSARPRSATSSSGTTPCQCKAPSGAGRASTGRIAASARARQCVPRVTSHLQRAPPPRGPRSGPPREA